MEKEQKSAHHKIVILGAGFGGLGMAAQLRMSGINDFVVLERCADIGGVWRDNSYPGAACDTESHLYCYSFHPHLSVSAVYAGRDELLRYMRTLVERFDLADRIRLGIEIQRATWDAADRVWQFELSDGSHLTSRFFVPAWGQLNRPLQPGFPGLDAFEGRHFHSAQWCHDVDLRGKRVASIGNAASAVQYLPEIAPLVAGLTVFQRSANWIVPRNQLEFSADQLAAYEKEPALFEESRRTLHAFRESVFGRTQHGTTEQKDGQRVALEHLHRQVPDPVLREKLTPDYAFACKRILRSDDYYPTLMRPNVRLETAGVDRFYRHGIVTRDGRECEFDVVIFGTGFESQSFQGDLQITGLGPSLKDAWSDGAQAYLGMSVPTFPNMFILYGPNTNLNHNSIMTMLEIQQRYVIDAIRAADAMGGCAWQVRQAVFEGFNRQLQEDMKRSAFSADCSSWYKNAQGKVINNWSGAVDDYRAVAQWNASAFDAIEPSR